MLIFTQLLAHPPITLQLPIYVRCHFNAAPHTLSSLLLTLLLSFTLLCTSCTHSAELQSSEFTTDRLNLYSSAVTLISAIIHITQQLIPSKNFRREVRVALCSVLLCPFLLITFITAAWAHAWLKILGIRTGHTEVQLSFKHSLPHPLALLTGRGAAG